MSSEFVVTYGKTVIFFDGNVNTSEILLLLIGLFFIAMTLPLEFFKSSKGVLPRISGSVLNISFLTFL